MAVPFVIQGSNSEVGAKVTPSGELVVAPLSYDETVFNVLSTINVGVNFYGPLPQKQFVITGIVFRADKDVSNVADATVVVYEASDSDTATVDKVLYQFAVVRDDKIELTQLRVLVAPGKFINAKTDDADIHMTITGYYIEEL